MAAEGLRSVSGWMERGRAGRLVSSDRDAAAVRLDAAAGPLLLKWRAPAPPRRWRTWLRPSRERAEARGALAARRVGIAAPAPLLVGERRDRWGRLLGSVLLRPWLEGWRPADEALAAPGGGALAPRLGEALARWHTAGYRHGDAWPKNLLLDDAAERVLPVGAPQARVVRAGRRLDRRALRDLSRLVAGLAGLAPLGVATDADPGGALAAYVEARGLRGDAGGLRRRVEAFLARLLRNRAEDERTRPLREPLGPPAPVPLPPDRDPVERRARPWASL